VSLPLVALMQWHWHQLIQTLWLFTRPAALLEQTLPLTQAQAAESRLNLGLPLLLLAPLAIEAPAAKPEPAPAPEPEPEPEPEPKALTEPADEASKESEKLSITEETALEVTEPIEEAPDEAQAIEAEPSADSGDLIVDTGVTVAPEEPTEEHESANLDPEVTQGDGLPS
jgi:outer membrane biosynthesis protein TonB